ncbi:hypothetical protein CRI94_11835 [Longibacter salinarum]|uniref:Uncharacterized protein n=1 Tax=Longibacter salinarum TaxID=1850348 RepID=A0A2A8CVJ9_9BACT|nr:hypothetical protein CRI94_11835 [Longibacter salinarum]
MDYEHVEGGLWVIEGRKAGSEASNTYEPMNLPAIFEVDGQRVRVRARVRDDVGSIYMTGPTIEIRSIESRD